MRGPGEAPQSHGPALWRPPPDSVPAAWERKTVSRRCCRTPRRPIRPQGKARPHRSEDRTGPAPCSRTRFDSASSAQPARRARRVRMRLHARSRRSRRRCAACPPQTAAAPTEAWSGSAAASPRSAKRFGPSRRRRKTAPAENGSGCPNPRNGKPGSTPREPGGLPMGTCRRTGWPEPDRGRPQQGRPRIAVAGDTFRNPSRSHPQKCPRKGRCPQRSRIFCRGGGLSRGCPRSSRH